MEESSFQQPQATQQQPFHNSNYPQFQGHGQQPLKNSGMGIASFIISLLIGPGLFFLILIAGVIEASTPGGMSETSPTAVFLGLFMIFSVGLSIIGAGLGIAGVVQRDRKKTFAILGLIFNILVLIVFFLLMLLGLLAS